MCLVHQSIHHRPHRLTIILVSVYMFPPYSSRVACVPGDMSLECHTCLCCSPVYSFYRKLPVVSMTQRREEVYTVCTCKTKNYSRTTVLPLFTILSLIEATSIVSTPKATFCTKSRTIPLVISCAVRIVFMLYLWRSPSLFNCFSLDAWRWRWRRRRAWPHYVHFRSYGGLFSW